MDMDVDMDMDIDMDIDIINILIDMIDVEISTFVIGVNHTISTNCVKMAVCTYI